MTRCPIFDGCQLHFAVLCFIQFVVDCVGFAKKSLGLMVCFHLPLLTAEQVPRGSRGSWLIRKHRRPIRNCSPPARRGRFIGSNQNWKTTEIVSVGARRVIFKFSFPQRLGSMKVYGIAGAIYAMVGTGSKCHMYRIGPKQEDMWRVVYHQVHVQDFRGALERTQY